MKHSIVTFVPNTMDRRSQTTAPPLLVTASEAARLLSLAPRTIYALVQSGQLPCVRIGKSVRIPRKAVEALARGEHP